MLKKIQESVDFIRTKTDLQPKVAIILGTGLGQLAEQIQSPVKIPYEHIPYFPLSTVESHSGKLIFGFLADVPVVVMQGRFHYYEGYSLKEATYPIRIFQKLGLKNLFLSNACGAVNQNIKTGDLMVIKDHINLLPDNPLRGKNINELGPRFPEMSEPYDKEWVNAAMIFSGDLPVDVHKGVYVAVPGPNLETAAEYKYIRVIGGDVVGMSTVPEVIVAKHAGMKCFAVSVVTDVGYGEVLEAVSLADVLAAAAKAEPHMTALFIKMLNLVKV